MARDLIQVLSCDRHSWQGETVSGVSQDDMEAMSGLLTPDAKTVISTVAIGFDGMWKELDWCPECLLELVAPLQELWEERGIDIEAPKRRGRPPGPKVGDGRPGRVVPDSEKDKQCLWCVEKYAADSGYTNHLHTKHGLAKSLTAVFGRQCPLCGEDDINRLGGHCKEKHSCSHVSQAFIRARGNGDEYGVVAAVEGQAKKVA